MRIEDILISYSVKGLSMNTINTILANCTTTIILEIYDNIGNISREA